MVKLECYLRPEKLEAVKEALNDYGIKGMSISSVMGAGMQKGRTEVYRGTQININLLPKIKLEIFTATDKSADEIAKIIKGKAYTGSIGDGKIFILPVNDAIRVRTGETGEDAVK
jgi:nitrogen regulatory protein P-II